jgi:hypothetical protein
MTERPDNTLRCWCNQCNGDTLHEIKAEYGIKVPGMMLHGREMHRNEYYYVVSCRGCGECHFLKIRIGAEDSIWTLGHERPFDSPLVQTNYPPRNIARRIPKWVGDLDDNLAALFHEAYGALSIGAVRLAAMGVRAILEHVAITVVGDQGSFKKNIQVLATAGHISTKSVDIVMSALEVGSAAIHRGYCPDLKDIRDVCAIVENVVEGVHIVPKSGERLKASTPPRPPHSRSTS